VAVSIAALAAVSSRVASRRHARGVVADQQRVARHRPDAAVGVDDGDLDAQDAERLLRADRCEAEPKGDYEQRDLPPEEVLPPKGGSHK
jgi:hypothetical protein